LGIEIRRQAGQQKKEHNAGIAKNKKPLGEKAEPGGHDTRISLIRMNKPNIQTRGKRYITHGDKPLSLLKNDNCG
jgi:hypothetical protein